MDNEMRWGGLCGTRRDAADIPDDVLVLVCLSVTVAWYRTSVSTDNTVQTDDGELAQSIAIEEMGGRGTTYFGPCFPWEPISSLITWHWVHRVYQSLSIRHDLESGHMKITTESIP